MRFCRLLDAEESRFIAQPETFMGLQIVVIKDTGRIAAILGGYLVVLLDEQEDERTLDYLSEEWMRPLVADREKKFNLWLGSLEGVGADSLSDAVSSRSDYRVFPIDNIPRAPEPPSSIHGHLPFRGATGLNNVFYHYAATPICTKIDCATGAIKGPIFTSPPSELLFLPTGFAAVSRLALPSVVPACFRWELRPPQNTPSRCGAGVPLYGQSGGGVEVFFSSGFQNVGHVADPVVLPPL